MSTHRQHPAVVPTALAGHLRAAEPTARLVEPVGPSASVSTSASVGASASVEWSRGWVEDGLRTSVRNTGSAPIAIAEIVLMAGQVELAAGTPVYGDGFQMLSQYEGVVGEVELLGGYADADHYRLPRHRHPRTGAPLATVHNLAVFGDASSGYALVGFTSCRRFDAQIRFAPSYLEIVVATEGRRLEPGRTWQLEDLFVRTGNDLDDLLAEFGRRIGATHPPLSVGPVPTGWCSWYCFGPEVTDDDITRNADVMTGVTAATIDSADREFAGEGGLRFVLVDDGYQARMGDWFDPAPNVSDIAELCRRATDRGLEPAVWVAPFIAEAGARVLCDHPEWFVHDAAGQPLPSDQISFGGWRNGPWYCLDGTNPDARRHLRATLARMRTDWGCRYFKLDAQVWGALPGGHRYDPAATSVQAYRLAMAEIVDEVAPDGILLGCNAPMWPSLGLVHAMRVTGDISRRWDAVRSVAREGLRRGWQHRALWLNDPDCLVVGPATRSVLGPDGVERRNTAELPIAQASMLAAFVRATGGLVFAGDDLPTLESDRARLLAACLPPTGDAARFGNTDYSVGIIERTHSTEYVLLNWTEQECQLQLPPAATGRFVDLLTGADATLLAGAGGGRFVAMPTRSGRVLVPADPSHPGGTP